MVVYLDTSALLKLYLREEGREVVREAVKVAAVAATSTVAYAEARAGLARRFREGDFTEEEHRGAVSDLDEDWTTYARLDVSKLVARRAGELAQRHALRGFDAVRLAERFEDLRFLAFDGRLTNAASVAVYGEETNAGPAPPSRCT